MTPLRGGPRQLARWAAARGGRAQRRITRSRIRRKLRPTLPAKQLIGVVGCSARSAEDRQRAPTLAAEAHAGPILSGTGRADHAAKGTFLRRLRSTKAIPAPCRRQVRVLRGTARR